MFVVWGGMNMFPLVGVVMSLVEGASFGASVYEMFKD